jgi:geranylgeranyl diphosphate synthase type II
MDGPRFQSLHESLIGEAEDALRALTPAADTRPARLHAAMRYSLEAGGKRLRPVIALAAARAFDPSADARPVAVALECIHTYSLIHDDLPCMDDAALRRGRPSCHRAFDEATALLAGDALLPLAFEVLARGHGERPALLRDLTLELAVASGSGLLVGGQTEDMGGLAAGADPERLEFILRGKTAAMLSAAFAMGAMVGAASQSDIAAFRQAGRAAGIAFQLVDDLLDLTADAAQMGKPVGADAQNNKLTYAGLFGVAATQERIQALTAEAIDGLQGTRGDTTFLRELVRRMATRRR